jgi:hypothetical protein
MVAAQLVTNAILEIRFYPGQAPGSRLALDRPLAARGLRAELLEFRLALLLKV